jgi:hypothetical protein
MLDKKVLLREFEMLCPGGVCQDLLTEEEKHIIKNGNIILTGVLQRANTKNGNGRIYRRSILEREVENYQKTVKERRALGECDHPSDPIVNLKNVSHLVRQIWWDGDKVMGKVEILPTPSGKILQTLIESGINLGISSRGLGSLQESSDGIIVQEDFQLICFDMVSEPSTPNAFMLAEAKEYDLKQVFTKADRINRLLNDILLNK